MNNKESKRYNENSCTIRMLLVVLPVWKLLTLNYKNRGMVESYIGHNIPNKGIVLGKTFILY